MQNHIAVLAISVLQRALEKEGMWLEFRHMASYLILYSSHYLCEDLLHMVILCQGYLTLLHPDNQVVLQQLCSLPFQYFSDPASPLFSSPPSSPAATTTTPTDASSNRS
ncbi:hypothetical protein ACOMHN_052206 [Nucella lapillus]